MKTFEKEHYDHHFTNEEGSYVSFRVQETNVGDSEYRTIMINKYNPKISWTCRLTKMDYEELKNFL